MPPWRRETARILPVDAEGRVLLLHGWDPNHPEAPFWFSIGGGAEGSESLAEAGVRELREETGIVIDAAELGEPVGRNTVEFHFAHYHIIQNQAYYAVLVETADVTLDGLDQLERASTDKAAWLFAEDFGPDERPADPDLPDLMRAAAAAIRARPLNRAPRE